MCVCACVCVCVHAYACVYACAYVHVCMCGGVWRLEANAHGKELSCLYCSLYSLFYTNLLTLFYKVLYIVPRFPGILEVKHLST